MWEYCGIEFDCVCCALKYTHFECAGISNCSDTGKRIWMFACMCENVWRMRMYMFNGCYLLLLLLSLACGCGSVRTCAKCHAIWKCMHVTMRGLWECSHKLSQPKSTSQHNEPGKTCLFHANKRERKKGK